MQERIEARAGLNGCGAGYDVMATADGWSGKEEEPLPLPMPPHAVRTSAIWDILADPMRREALRQRVEEGVESLSAIAKDIGVSDPTLGRAVRRLGWVRPPGAPKSPRRKAGADAADDPAGAVKGRLLAVLDRQIALVEKRLKGKSAEVEEKDSRTRGDLVRALGAFVAARPSVDAAVQAKAEAIAARIEAAAVEARVVRRGHADHAVEARGAGLFAREFGSVDAPAEPVVGPAAEGGAR